MGRKKKTEPNTRQLIGDKVAIDEIPKVLKEKFKAYSIATNAIDWCMRVAVGHEDIYTITREVYELGDDTPAIKRKAREMMANHKHQLMVNSIRENLAVEATINSSTILNRLEFLYGEAIMSDNHKMALDVLKQMTTIVTNLNGSVTVSDITIKFELPTTPKNNTIEIDPIE